MANFDNLRKQAKLLVRWHRAGNYSVGGRIRSLPRYRNLTDVETLALKFPLSEAQEIIALESGYESWAALKSGVSTMEVQAQSLAGPVLKGAVPVVFVSNVQASAAFFRDKLGFAIDFLHGDPPFYASVSRVQLVYISASSTNQSSLLEYANERGTLVRVSRCRQHQRSVRRIQSCGSRFCPAPQEGTLGSVWVYGTRSR